jgi:hypothetical protein
MKVKNSSDWETQDLLPLIHENMKRAGMKGKYLTIFVDTARYSPRYKSCGNYLGHWWPGARIRLGVPPAGMDGDFIDRQFNPVALSQILQHELDHERGLAHKDMQYWWTIPVDWAKPFNVRPKITTNLAAKPPKRDLPRERYDRIIERATLLLDLLSSAAMNVEAQKP